MGNWKRQNWSIKFIIFVINKNMVSKKQLKTIDYINFLFYIIKFLEFTIYIKIKYKILAIF